ncbi:MAG TPA: type II toxin-antitoxin system RelE/ParE family toxin [Verrucomicrobiae bacterium]|jgi:plasmid stabilization system protein ParE
MTVRVLEAAAADLESAAEFYDKQQPGIGDYFKISLIADIESLILFHGIHTVHWGNYRMLASRFPFGIYYRETSTEVQVIAVLDLRKNPSWLRGELSQRI